MARVPWKVKVRGRDCWALFDTRMPHTYVTEELASVLFTIATSRTTKSEFGAGVIKGATRIALLHAEVEGRFVSTYAKVVDEIPVADGKDRVDILFGHLCMLQWAIHPVQGENQLDLGPYAGTPREPSASGELQMDKEKKRSFDALQALNDQEWAEFQEKTQVEWRFSLAVWTALAGLIGSVLVAKSRGLVTFPARYCMIVALCVGVPLLVCMHFVLLVWV